LPFGALVHTHNTQNKNKTGKKRLMGEKEKGKEKKNRKSIT
jgi:hypothetical protein